MADVSSTTRDDEPPRGGGSMGVVIPLLRDEAHGGRLFVEGEPGSSAVFGFVLPADCLAGPWEPHVPDGSRG